MIISAALIISIPLFLIAWDIERIRKDNNDSKK